MSAIFALAETAYENPIDTVEQLVSDQDWPFERCSDGDLAVCVSGSWCDYNLAFARSVEMETLTLSAAFDFRVPRPRRGELCVLLALVNERLALGHFDLAATEGMILYRHGVALGGGARAGAGQCEQMLQAALDACERFYPAFQFVLWGGQTAEEALAGAILDCRGEA